MSYVKPSKQKELNRTEQEWEEILKEIDRDGNEEINFDEFIIAMDKVIHPETTHPKAENKIQPEEEKSKEPPEHQTTKEPDLGVAKIE